MGAYRSPAPLPNGQVIVSYAANASDLSNFTGNFDLYIVPVKGGEPERITFDEQFDGFPMFSPDGKRLVWAANRHGSQPRETNLFLAECRD